MNSINKFKKYFIIGIVFILLIVFFMIGIGIATGEYTGLSPLAVTLLLGSFIFALVFFGCICTWVYKDSVIRGQNGFLWALIMLVTTPFVGLIVYFISRKDEMINCKSCNNRISKRANYCEHCGIMIENNSQSINSLYGNKDLEYKVKNKEEHVMTKANRNIRLIVVGTIGAMLMTVCLVAFMIIAFTSDSFIDKSIWNTGVISSSYENKIGNEWKLNFKSASNGYRKRDTLKIKDGDQFLYAEVECGEGELLLYIEQGSKQEIIDVSNLEQPLVYPLNDFEKGKITVIFEINGARNVKSYIAIK